MSHNSRPLPLLWHSYLGLGVTGAFSAIWPLPSILLSLFIPVLDKRLGKPANLAAGILVFLLGMLIIHWRIHPEAPDLAAVPAWLDASPRVCGQITETQGLPGQRLRIILAKVKPENTDVAPPLPGYVRWTLREVPPDFSPVPGMSACISRKLFRSRKLANGNGPPDTSLFIHREYWTISSKGTDGDPALSGNGFFWAALRSKIKNAFLEILKPEAASENPRQQAKAILPAFLFGDRYYLSTDTVNDFVSGSLAHSLALSGQHLCVAGLAAFLAVLFSAAVHRRLYLKRPRIYLIAILSIPFALAYLWLGNAPPSLLRATCMLLVLSFWTLRDSAWHGMDLVCAALLILICLEPLSLFETGMQFSVICVLIIALVGPLIPKIPFIKKTRPLAKSSPLRWLWQIFWLSLGIQLFLIPPTLAHFSQTSLWFPLNLFWLPLLGFAVLPLAFSGLAAIPLAPELAGTLVDLAAAPCLWLLELFSYLHEKNALDQIPFLLPHWGAICAFILLSGAFLAIYGHKNKKCSSFLAISALLFLVCGPCLRLMNYLQTEQEISVLDTGQAQAILVKFSGTGQLLIDGGGAYGSGFDAGKAVLAPALSQNRPPHLDAAINSHPDLDHLGGLLSLIPFFGCEHFFHNGHAPDREYIEKWQNIKRKENILYAGDVLYLGKKEDNLKLEVLHPPASPFPDENGNRTIHPKYLGNNASLVLRLCKGDSGLALFPGDAGKAVLQELAKSGKNLQAKVLIAAHHGSDRSLSPEFYRQVNPEMIIASCGYQNRWSFPGKNLRRFLEKRQKPLYATSQSGRINIKFGSANNPELQFARK